MAGEKAVRSSANLEAIGHFRKALQLIVNVRETQQVLQQELAPKNGLGTAMPDHTDRVQQELRLQMALGAALMAIKGYAAAEAGKAYGRALELCQQLGETPRLFPVLGGLLAFNMMRGELRTARELAGQLLRLAQNLQTPALLQSAHYGMVEVLFELGELAQSQKHLEQAIALYQPRRRRVRAFHDPGVACQAIAALTLWTLGYPDQAVKRIRESLTLAQELSHPFSLALALDCTARFHRFRREIDATREHAEALIALSHEHGFTLREALGVGMRGWALAKQGQVEEGIVQIRQGLVGAQVTGAELWQPDLLALLGEAYGEAGQADEGLTAVTEALDRASRSGRAFNEPASYQLKGALLLMQNGFHATQAESCFQRAIEIARKQSAKSWELRATTSLARLFARQGRRDEARTMLAEIYNWFTEGFDTADLKEAKALLDELSP